MRYLLRKRNLVLFMIAAFLVGGFFVRGGYVEASSTLNVKSDATNLNYRNAIVKAADRIVALQNEGGSWDWVVTKAAGPSSANYENLAGVTAEGLIDSYRLTGDTKYLDSAKKAGDYLLSLPIESTRRINGYNIIFLYHLGDITGNSSYSEEADALFKHITSEENYWNCDEGCSAAELLDAYKNFRGANTVPDGTIIWDLAPFVEAAKIAKNDTFKDELATIINKYLNETDYNADISSFELGLGSGIKALEIAGQDNGLALSKLIAMQDESGYFNDEDEIQTNAYALMGLKKVGSEGASSAAQHLFSKFGYPEINGWLESDEEEYAESDSEAIQALFDFIYEPDTYYTLADAVNSSHAGDTIKIQEGTYELSSQLNIEKSISIEGNNKVTIKADPTVAWSTINGYKHLILLMSGSESNPVTLSNLTLDATGTYGLNTYNNAYGILNDITITNSKGAALTVNGSTIEATNFITENNNWGGVNIDPGSGVLTPSIFTFNSGNISEKGKIWSDGNHVTEEVTVTVNAPEYELRVDPENELAKSWIKVIANVNNLSELKEALTDGNIKTINLKADITSEGAPIIIDREVTFNGNSHTLSFTGLKEVSGSADDGLIINKAAIINDLKVDAGLVTPATWVGTYAIHVYNTTATLNNITALNGNGGILINGSQVTLTGKIDVSKNGFGGIESSLGSGLTTKPSIIATSVTFNNSTEAYGLPTIWEDGVTETITALDSMFTQIVKGTQAQYYLLKSNSKPYVAPSNNGGGGGGGGGVVSYCSNVVYSEWGACENGNQYRTVITQSPSYCSLSVKQQLDRSRPCATPAIPTTPKIEPNIPTLPAIPANPITKKVLGEKKYAEGTLLKSINNKIYVIIDGKIKYIPTLKQLAIYKGPVLKVDDSVISSFESYPSVLGAKKYSDGTLLKAKGDVKIYIIKEGKKIHIRSLTELKRYKGKVLSVEPSELNSY